MTALVSCALRGEVPDAALLERVEPEPLFAVCQKHILTACAAFALESAGIRDPRFKQAKEKAIRKNILLDAERERILKALEAKQIWYMPLKGALLKDWYPKLGMRQMSDNDILCDGSRMDDVREIFLQSGYTCGTAPHQHNHDVYFKQPVLNFEMHRTLFSASNAELGARAEYFSDIKPRLLPEPGSEYGFRFTDEDFYLYMLLHEFKHYSRGGTGVRSLADTYVFLRRFGDTLDRDYIRAELEKLALTDFEAQNRMLAEKLFSGKTLTDAESGLLDYYIFSGTYGTAAHLFENRFREIGGGSRGKYLLHRLFPPYARLKQAVPWAEKSRLLVPAAYVYRLIRAAAGSREQIRKELRYLSAEKREGAAPEKKP